MHDTFVDGEYHIIFVSHHMVYFVKIAGYRRFLILQTGHVPLLAADMICVV